jgi:hypothetical protein
LRTHYGSNFRYVVMSTWTGTHLVQPRSTLRLSFRG